jgi:hypothetical protein
MPSPLLQPLLKPLPPHNFKLGGKHQLLYLSRHGLLLVPEENDITLLNYRGCKTGFMDVGAQHVTQLGLGSAALSGGPTCILVSTRILSAGGN